MDIAPRLCAKYTESIIAMTVSYRIAYRKYSLNYARIYFCLNKKPKQTKKQRRIGADLE